MSKKIENNSYTIFNVGLTTVAFLYISIQNLISNKFDMLPVIIVVLGVVYFIGIVLIHKKVL